jgi:hypothetical protein
LQKNYGVVTGGFWAFLLAFLRGVAQKEVFFAWFFVVTTW